MPRITIVGLGLIGTSWGLALRRLAGGQPRGEPVQVLGYDLESGRRREAERLGAIDKGVRSLVDAVGESALIIVAVPPLAVRAVLADMAPHLRPGAVVTDTASTKAMILRWARELLPTGVSFVGGHPMAGRTESQAAASADLLAGCIYCLVPAPGADAAAVETVAGMVAAVGARPYFLGADEHDGLVAAVSHLPFVVSTALVRLVASSASWRELKQLAAGGFGDLSRIAAGDAVMYRDICVTNREHLLHWLDRYAEAIAHMRDLIDQAGPEGAGLAETFQEARTAREEWQREASQGPAPDERSPLPAAGLGASLSQLFLGGLASRPPIPGERKE